MADIRWEVEFVRESAPTRVWSKKSFHDKGKARRAARDSLGRVMGDSGTPIVKATVFERTEIAVYQ